MITAVGIILSLFVGYYIGLNHSELKTRIKELEKSKKEEVGVTLGSYGPINHYTGSSSDVGVVMPKTPQQLEWEENQRLQQAQTDVKVKDKN